MRNTLLAILLASLVSLAGASYSMKELKDEMKRHMSEVEKTFKMEEEGSRKKVFKNSFYESVFNIIKSTNTLIKGPGKLKAEDVSEKRVGYLNVIYGKIVELSTVATEIIEEGILKVTKQEFTEKLEWQNNKDEKVISITKVLFALKYLTENCRRYTIADDSCGKVKQQVTDFQDSYFNVTELPNIAINDIVKEIDALTAQEVPTDEIRVKYRVVDKCAGVKNN